MSTVFAPILSKVPLLPAKLAAVLAQVPAIPAKLTVIAAQLARTATRIATIAPEIATITAEFAAIEPEVPAVVTKLAVLRARAPVLAAGARMEGVLRACGGRRKGRRSEQEGSKKNSTHSIDPLKETPCRRRAPDRVKRSGAPG